jgi:ribosomal protein S12 methylthiotransferase accessory factor
MSVTSSRFVPVRLGSLYRNNWMSEQVNNHFPLQVIGNHRLARIFQERLPALVRGLLLVDDRSGEELGGHLLTLAISRLEELSFELLTRRTVVFQISFWRSLIYIGPFWMPGMQGCSYCLLSRVSNSAYGPALDRAGHIETPTHVDDKGPVLPPATIIGVTHLVAEQLTDHIAGRTPRTSKGVYVLNIETGTLAFERIVPDSTCPLCAPLPLGTLPNFELRHSSAGRSTGGYRLASPDHLRELLERTYVQPHVGIVKEVLQDLQSPFGSCSLELHEKRSQREFTIGRSDTYKKSHAIAILEGLERHSGLRSDGIGGIISVSFNEASEYAINPVSLGLHPDDCYRLPDYPLVPFDPEVPIDWVWGYSFKEQQPLLVPTSVAFYGYRPVGRHPFVSETSNGCALGSSIEEATIHALLEVVERDAFLMTWYRKLVLPELLLSDIPDQKTRALLRKAGLFADCQFRAFLSTMEHGIPSLVLVAIANRPDGGPCIMASGSAHPNLWRALRRAVYELTGLVLRLRHSYHQKREAVLAMLNDSNLVQSIEDHPQVNALPEARERFSFLLHQEWKQIPFAKIGEARWTEKRDIRDHLDFLVGCMLPSRLDVIVVDQTTAELRACGLFCVKVIVPGLLPMTFGHRFRRVQLPRLLTDGVLSMYDSQICSPHEIGMIPHPFS